MDLPAASCVEAVPGSSEIMAPLYLQNVLQKARCMTDGQLTPPPSPSYPLHGALSSRLVTKSRAARLPGVYSQRAKHALETHQKESSETYGTLNTQQWSLPSPQETNTRELRMTTPPISPEYTENTDEASELKVIQPESKSIGTPLSRSSSQEHHHSRSPIIPSIDLRRISHAYEDLRDVALEHEKGFRLVLPATSPLHTPLLPSPIIDNRDMYFNEESSVSFKFENPRQLAHSTGDPSYRSYDDMQIISCYEDAPSVSVENGWSHIAEAHTITQSIKMKDSGEGPSWKAAGYHHKTTSCSSAGSKEADWLANTTSHQERLHRFKTRCCQVVQQSPPAHISRHEEEGKVMLATVLVGPGKPRLVQIQRPPSSVNSLRSSKPSNTSAQSLPQETPPMRVPPSTPIHHCREISAFSPYDTPSITTPFTDVSRTTLAKIMSPIEQTPLSASKLDLVPKPLSFMRSASSDTAHTKTSSTGHHLRQLARDLSSAYSGSSENSDLLNDSIATSWTKSHTHQTSSASGEAFTRIEDLTLLEGNLDAIAKAIDEFPQRLLGLGSQQILKLRRSPSSEKNQTHIDSLAKVFVNAPRQLLSVLAAWVIIDSFVSKICTIEVDTDASSRREGVKLQERQQNLNDRAMKPRIPKRSVSLGFSRTNPKPQKPSYRLFPLPPRILSKSKTHSDLSAPAQEATMSRKSLRSVPIKARSILGLDQQQHVALDSSAQLIITRAKAMSISVGVVAQKLMEVLRGEDGWDPYLWRALAVLIDTIETTEIGHGVPLV